MTACLVVPPKSPSTSINQNPSSSNRSWIRAVSNPSFLPTATNGAMSGVTSGRVVVVVGTAVVVGASVVVVVDVVVVTGVVEVVVDSTNGTDDTSVVPCAEPDAHAEAVRSRTNDPATTRLWRNMDIPSKYPLSRAKCWQPHRVHCVLKQLRQKGVFTFWSERINP